MADSVTRRALLQEVARRGWQAEEIGPKAYFLKITHPDGRWEMVRGTCPRRSSAIGLMLCKHKHLTMAFADLYGYTTPDFCVLTDLQQASDFLKQQQRIVLKPADGQRSEGVTVNIVDEAQLQRAYDHAKANSESGQLIAQTHLTGNLYRLLILDGQLVAASWRIAATVTGDGIQTVEQLIAQANQDPRRSHGNDTPLKSIDTEHARELLGDQFSHVAEPGEKVVVSAIDSVSAGGEAINVTDQVHPDWRRICTQLTRDAGLFICGFDVICDDIANPIQNNYLPLLEMNAGPGIKLHEFPTGGGDPIHVAPLLLDALFA